MLEIIAKIIFALLAIVGIADIFRTFIFWLLQSNSQGKLYLIVSINGHEERAELILTSAIERLKWMKGKEKKLICLNKGMDEETKKVCGIISAQNPGVEICTPEELPNILDQ
jgi:hypothetical protein